MEVVEIKSECGNAAARLLPELGMNCFSLRLAQNDQVANVIYAPDEFETGEVRPSSGGVPVLFPFPGRIRSGVFQWEGTEYRLPQNDRKGNAIHGFVFDRAWKVVEKKADSIVASFQASEHDAGILKLWPADFLIELEFRFVNAARFEMNTKISNPDDKPLPFGYGLHPYFQVPFDGTAVDSVRVTLPVSEQWELEDLVPTGKHQAVDSSEKYNEGITFDDMDFDDVFSIEHEEEKGADSSRIISSGNELKYEFDGFDYCVVYTPASRTSVCVEPYTSTPNPFELTERKIDCGLKILQPGESIEYQTSLQLV